MLKLIIVRGLPGSGKSTLAKGYEGFLHYEPDHLFCDTNGAYRFDAQLWGEALVFVEKLTDNALARGESVVVSDVFCTSTDVAPYRKLAKHHGAWFKVVTCRGRYGNIHHVPLWVLNRMKELFEDEIV